MSQVSAGRGRLFGFGRISIVCALVAAFALLLPAASLAAGGTVSGTVTAAVDESPLEGIEVCAFGISPPSFGGCDVSGANGAYAITGLSAGSHRIGFESLDSTFIKQYYDGVSGWFDADPVTVSEGATTAGIDAAMEESGSITGTVTDAAGGGPIGGIMACAEDKHDSFSSSTCVNTEGDGTYTIEGLRESDYAVGFHGTFVETGPDEYEPLNYIPQYYDGKAREDEADLVGVTAGAETAGIDAALEEGAEVAGTVVDAEEEPVESIEVCLYSAANGSGGRCTTTDSSGNYLLFGLPSGNYKVGFGIESFSSPYTPQYYDDAPTLAEADVVALTVGSQTSGIDAVLREAGRVAGTVTAAGTGTGIENLQVCAQPVGFGGAKCAQTGAGGDYTITGARPGEYVVEFRGAPGYLTQYYSGKASYPEADRITVEEEATASGIDATMQVAGQIKGKVVDANGDPFSGIEVCAVKSSASSYFGGPCAQSGLDGSYAVGGLPSGSYDVRFAAGFGEVGPGEFGKLNYLTQYYKGGSSRSEADPVAVTVGKVTAGIDATMQVGGKISGTVVDADTGEGVQAYVCVMPAVRHGGDEGCAFAGENGAYAVRGLRSGSYKVRFGPGPSQLGYLREFYDGKAKKSEADPVAVTADATTTGIDAELDRGGTIAGTVTDAADDAPLAGIEVCLGSFGSCDATAADGSYELSGLPTGSYRVHFRSGSSTRKYAPVYYHDALSRIEAQPVAVAAGQVTADVDQEMHEGARVSGTAVDAISKDPLLNLSVCATDPGSGAGDCTLTNADGEYTLRGLPAGGYRVRFSSQNAIPTGVNPKYATQYFDGVELPAEATILDLSLGEVAEAVDAEMQEGGSIDGTVTLASSHAPLSDISVCAVPESGEEEWLEECVVTNGSGEYSLEGLTTGSYVVDFYPGYSIFERPNLLRQYFDGAQRRSDATPVSVTAGSTVSGVDAEIGAGGKITGLITAAADGAPLEGVEACAYEAEDEEVPYACGSSNAHGEYAITQLATGLYRVKFSALFYEWEEDPFQEEEGEPAAQEELKTQFYNGKGSLATATAVTVTAGGTTPGINAQMVKPGDPPFEEPQGETGGSLPPPLSPPPTAAPPPAKPRPFKCRKGFKKKVVRGKRRCVKIHKHRHKRRQHRGR